MPQTLTGTDLKELKSILLEHFDPGQTVALVVGVAEAPSYEQLQKLANHLAANGLSVSVDAGSTKEWANAVRLIFTRPSRSVGVGFLPVLPIPLLIIGGLLLAGFTGVLGFKITEAVQQNIVPLAAIAAAAFILSAYLKEGNSG